MGKFKKVRDIQERNEETGQFLPVDGTLSKKCMGAVFSDKRTRQSKLLRARLDYFVQAAGGPAEMDAYQWHILNEMEWPLQVMIVGRMFMYQQEEWVLKTGDMYQVVDRINAAQKTYLKLTDLFFATIQQEERDPYEEALKDLE